MSRMFWSKEKNEVWNLADGISSETIDLKPGMSINDFQKLKKIISHF